MNYKEIERKLYHELGHHIVNTIYKDYGRKETAEIKITEVKHNYFSGFDRYYGETIPVMGEPTELFEKYPFSTISSLTHGCVFESIYTKSRFEDLFSREDNDYLLSGYQDAKDCYNFVTCNLRLNDKIYISIINHSIKFVEDLKSQNFQLPELDIYKLVEIQKPITVVDEIHTSFKVNLKSLNEVTKEFTEDYKPVLDEYSKFIKNLT
ncbi:MAG: hypothetical protein WD048_08170 [Chitinophagales bacterium]